MWKSHHKRRYREVFLKDDEDISQQHGIYWHLISVRFPTNWFSSRRRQGGGCQRIAGSHARRGHRGHPAERSRLGLWGPPKIGVSKNRRYLLNIVIYIYSSGQSSFYQHNGLYFRTLCQPMSSYFLGPEWPMPMTIYDYHGTLFFKFMSTYLCQPDCQTWMTIGGWDLRRGSRWCPVGGLMWGAGHLFFLGTFVGFKICMDHIDVFTFIDFQGFFPTSWWGVLVFGCVLLLFSSLTLPISAFHLSIWSEVWLLRCLR